MKYVVENVIPYYEPLIPAKKRGRHLYWTNFLLPTNVGERKDEQSLVGPLIDAVPTPITLDSYFDANAHLGYKINDQLSVFAKVNNMLNQDYQRYLNFPVQGIQALAGATYQFDF